MEQLDYLEEPDMFHDIFGHIPLLLNPTFSKFAQAFGKLGQQFKGNNEMVKKLQRIYWFTIEFGLSHAGCVQSSPAVTRLTVYRGMQVPMCSHLSGSTEH